jgi:hypothetical protein
MLARAFVPVSAEPVTVMSGWARSESVVANVRVTSPMPLFSVLFAAVMRPAPMLGKASRAASMALTNVPAVAFQEIAFVV